MIEQTTHMFRKIIEGILEIFARWGIRMPKADVIGSDQVELSSESRDEFAEHLATGRESMQ